MTTDFRQLKREAFDRGIRDYERGISRSDNPHKDNFATSERESWNEGWDDAYQEDRAN